MDFKDIVLAEISAKRRQLEQASTAGRKFVRRGDLEPRPTPRAKEEPPSLPAPPEPAKKDSQVHPDDALPGDLNREIETRLQQIGEPVRLFAESDQKRQERLRLCEGLGPLVSTRREESPSGTPEAVGAMLVLKVSRPELARDPEGVRTRIATFLKRLLAEWEHDLASRPLDCPEGRLAQTAHQQAATNLRVFFRLLKQGQLPPDVVGHITEICGCLQSREYVRANDIYLRLAIGNAPWPIGVTMVGIHERSAREKISSSEVAHVLNDEATRKWIQSIKRLMTVCQRLYPPSDPAKAVWHYVMAGLDWVDGVDCRLQSGPAGQDALSLDLACSLTLTLILLNVLTLCGTCRFSEIYPEQNVAINVVVFYAEPFGKPCTQGRPDLVNYGFGF